MPKTVPHSQSKKVFKIRNLTDEEATLVEPTSCAIHGVDMLGPTAGVKALVFGAGPTGCYITSQLHLTEIYLQVLSSHNCSN